MLIDLEAMRLVRLAEMRAVLPHLPAGGRILELGGGSGWQAAQLASSGYEVQSVDVAGNPYKNRLVFPVVEYDGQHLPYAAGSFDAVFSSNVLEHVPDLDNVLGECARVLRRGGVAVHLMPTPSWRILTLVTHFPWLLKVACGVIASKLITNRIPTNLQRNTAGRWAPLRKLLPVRHGEHGSCLSEVYGFSAGAWRRRLAAAGWCVVADFPVRITYSGYFVTYPLVGLAARRLLSRFLGSGCRAYVARPRVGDRRC